MTRPRIYYGWIVLAAGFIIMLLGYAVRNTFTVFYPVIVDDFGWARGNTAIMYSLTMLCYGLVAPFAGSLVDRFSPRVVISIGGLIVGGSIALCGFATEMWHFYLLYGVMVAIGLSLIGFTPLSSVLTHWFAHRKALVFGLLASGFGVSLVSAPVFQFLISTYGWRLSYAIIGGTATAIIVPLCIAFVRRSPEQHEQKTTEDPATSSNSVSASRDWTLRAALKTRTFRLFLTIAFLNMGFSQQIMVAHQVYFLQDIGFEPMVAASVFSIFGIGFVVGTASSGISDRLGRHQVFVPGSFVAAASVLLLFAAEANQSVALATAFAIVGGFTLGITAPTCFAGVADCFHGRNYGTIQGTMILSNALGGALGPWLGGFLHDVTGSYFTVLVIVQILIAGAGVLMWIIKPRVGKTPR
ncbi:MAG: MFS transporter [Dehalococcoidia bacterium]|nr:MFS transporter [Dehalococcoidia bacterium]